jgi:hypothetical protein
MHDYKERFYVEDSEPERRMRTALSELQTAMFSRQLHHDDWTYTYWFVLKAKRLHTGCTVVRN